MQSRRIGTLHHTDQVFIFSHPFAAATLAISRRRFLTQHVCPDPRAAPTERLRNLVLAVVRGKVLGFLARGDAHDLDGVADHVGGALLAFGPARHLLVGFL